MINRLYFYCKVAGFLLQGNVVKPDCIRRDYDRLSPTYDDYFSRYVGKHSRGLIRRLALSPGAKVVDLASGTGTLSLAMAEAVGSKGEVTGFDRSPGMLAVAERKRREGGFDNVRFVEGDISNVLSAFKDNSLDAITCGWAIGYVNPENLIQTAARKLGKGCKLGIIENVRDTLAPVKNTALKVAQALPRHFTQLMDLHFRLPRGPVDLGKLFKGANLSVIEIWEGEEMFRFENGAEVLAWVLHTGASAGFDMAMDPAVRQECDGLFVKFIERDYLRNGCITVAHHYVAGIARKEC